MRILVVAEQYPWPAIDGYRQRMDHMVRGLSGAGQVEVFAMWQEGTRAPEAPVLVDVLRTEAVSVGNCASMREWLPLWLRSGAPRRVLGPDWTGMRQRLEQRRDEGLDFDLVWFSHVDSWWPLRDVFRETPTIVDFDNLENIAMRLRRRVPPRFPPGSSPSDRARIRLRWVASRFFDLIDERRWRGLQLECAESVDRVVVCSELDLERSACRNASVIGNGAVAPAKPLIDRTDLMSPHPTLLFVGALDYEPNTEAVEWFASEVMPLLRARLPEARVRIVGRGAELVSWVGTVPGIDLVGPVDSVEPELLGADAVIVPIRVGAGTRLKVVEALANHLPLVTTSVGCEGIDVVDETSALIADNAGAFAGACVRVLTDGKLRQNLADSGAMLFRERYDWPTIHGEVATLALEVASRDS